MDKKSARIAEIRQTFFNGNNRKMSLNTGIEETYLSRICKGNAEPGDALFEKILQALPEISRSWLYLGEGEMMNKQSNQVNINNQNGDNFHVEQSVNVDMMKELLAEKDARINDQSERIAELKEAIRLLREQLAKYEELTGR